MGDVYDSIMQGLDIARSTVPGRIRPATIRPIAVDLPDVQAIRARTGLSQAEFARCIGVKRGTLINWEQKRRRPEGPAMVLLALIERDPAIVQRVLGRRAT
jgi:putative transcriptional regulator